MKAYIFNIFSAFVYTFGAELDHHKREFNRETSHVYEQFQNLPWYFSFAFGFITVMMSHFYGHRGVPFHRLSHENRAAKLNKIRRLKFSIAVDFIKFFNNLTVFMYYSLKEQNDS